MKAIIITPFLHYMTKKRNRIFFGGNSSKNLYTNFVKKNGAAQDTETLFNDEATDAAPVYSEPKKKLKKFPRKKRKIFTRGVVITIISSLVIIFIGFISNEIWQLSSKQNSYIVQTNNIQKDLDDLKNSNNKLSDVVNSNDKNVAILNQFSQNIQKDIDFIMLKLKIR